MKKSCKKLSFLMAIVLLLSSMAVINPVTADAKAKLNKKNLSLYVGNTYKLKVKGAKKKVKWSSNKKKVASVSKKGLVKARKEGFAIITAKSGKKRFLCVVTVQGRASIPNKPTPTITPGNVTTVSNSVLAANMSVIVEPIADSDYVICTVTNNNSQAIPYCTVNYQFKNIENAVVATGSVTVYAIGAGQTQYITEYVGKKYVPLIDVTKSVISVTVNAASMYVDATSSVTVNESMTVNGEISLTYFNADTKAVSITSTILFYDETGKLVDANWVYRYLDPGQTEFNTVIPPYEWNEAYEKVYTYSSYKIYNYAHKYI